MRTLTKKYLGGLAIEEDSYKVDLAVLDRYQAFSSELVRLALLGITGYGFLIANIAIKTEKDGRYTFVPPFPGNKVLLIFGAVALALSAATALGHRYFSTDALAHFVRRVRVSASIKDAPKTAEVLAAEKVIEHEELSLDQDVNRCRWLLVTSSLSLVAGAACIALAFASILFNSSQ
jgi:hypothetical protein